MDSDIGKNIDRISKLDDSILRHILSCLPTKYAVGTSILSTRWQYLWTSVPIIDIDEYQLFQDIDSLSGERQSDIDLSFQDFVSNVLDLNKASCFQKFRLRFASQEITCGLVDEWISAAVKHKVRDLDFQNLHDTIALPKKLFTSKTLVILRLYGAFLDVPRSVRFPSLKILDMKRIEYKKEDTLQKLLSGCPVLEKLVMSRWTRETYQVLNVSVPTLRHLKVVFDLDHDHQYSPDIAPDDRYCEFVIDAPFLEHLDLTNYVSENFVFRNVKSLSKASLLVEPHRVIDFGAHIYKLLARILNVKFLDAFLSLRSDVNDFMLPTFHNLTLLKFGADDNKSWMYGANWNLKLLADFLQCSPNLEALILKGSKFDKSAKSWNPPQEVPSCLSLRLKEIQVNGFSGKDYELEVIEYLLKNAKVLKKMTVDQQYLDDCFVEKLTAFPRGSKMCQLILL